MSFVRLLVCLCSCLEFGHGILSASKCGYIVGLIAKFEKGTIFSIYHHSGKVKVHNSFNRAQKCRCDNPSSS